MACAISQPSRCTASTTAAGNGCNRRRRYGQPGYRGRVRVGAAARRLSARVGGGGSRGRSGSAVSASGAHMASLRRFRLPASPVENSLEGRAFVFSGFAVATLAVVVYGQDYVVPAIALVATAIGHVVSYCERNQKRGFRRQVVLAGLVFAALAYFLGDSVGAFFGGVLPQANFAILLVAVTSFDLKTRRNCYSSLWITLAILYLAPVYAWDYPFGVLLALWPVCLAGFWTASNLRRMVARVNLPLPAAATALVGALVLALALFVFLPHPHLDPHAPPPSSLPNHPGLTPRTATP